MSTHFLGRRVTWLFLVNFVLLQWFFVRLAKEVFSGTTIRWLLIWVVPLTGWWSKYLFIGGKK